MYGITKRVTIGALLLLIMPLGVWLSGWQWHPHLTGGWLRVLFWITETVTSPWGVVTSSVLSLWLFWCLRFSLKSTLGVFAILIVTIGIGQGMKSAIKSWVQEPRPFVEWLEKSHQVDEAYFYSLPRSERSALVKSQLHDDQQLPKWLRHHWQAETGFAFPSGHTMFAASWALLAVGLLWARRHYVTVTIVMAWAVAVMGSRLALGMHWPQDLMMATAISWLLVLVATGLASRWCGPLTAAETEAEQEKQTVTLSHEGDA
ncbi:phosphatidylglycerophosphatase B [Lonsdalea quercina]|uniref:phosphatidylglycerophosphatase B n=1 Tax=Lonsdalea quercina TaxID=71657 RepID=UPI00397491F8